jgi:hypothetical protein
VPKTTVKRTVTVLAGLIAVLLVIFAVRFYVLGPPLKARVNQLEAAGEPVSIADLAPEPVPADQNAAVLLREIGGDLRAFSQKVRSYYDSPSYETGKPTDQELAMIEAAFAAHPDLLPTIERAVAAEDYHLDLDYSLPPQEFLSELMDQVGPQREVGRALSFHATVARAHGEWDEAVEAAISILRFARQLEGQGVLMSYLVAQAIRGTGVDAADLALQGGPVSQSTREALEAELALADPTAGYMAALSGERAFVIESQKDLPFPLRIGADPVEQIDMFGEDIRLATQPYSAYQAVQQKAAAAGKPTGTFAKMAQPQLQAARQSTERTRASVRALRVLNALTGRDDPDAPAPADLTELGLPKQATTDPFNDKPLQIKQTPASWRVYSTSEGGVGPTDQPIEVE